MTDIVARHDQVLPLVIPPANDDVGMRMPGVEVVDGHPVEPGVQIALHLGHEVADERLEVGKARSLISRDDEAELVGVLLRPVQEGAAIDVIAGRVVKAAGRALAGHPVADDVLEVRPRRAEVAGNDARVAGLDDHAAAAGRDQPCGRAHAGTHAALGRRRRDVASLPQRAGTMLSGLPEHESGVALAHGRVAHPVCVRAWDRTRLGPCSAPRSRVMARRDGVALREFKTASKIVLISNADFDR